MGRQVRCIWRVVLPLLDAGYQLDVRILNSVYYGVPQTRRVCLPARAASHLLTIMQCLTCWANLCPQQIRQCFLTLCLWCAHCIQLQGLHDHSSFLYITLAVPCAHSGSSFLRPGMATSCRRRPHPGRVPRVPALSQ